jgi:hypothetical protein
MIPIDNFSIRLNTTLQQAPTSIVHQNIKTITFPIESIGSFPNRVERH